MSTAIREMVTVKAGGLVEVRSPRLREGERAEVIVLLDEASTENAPSPSATWGEFIGSAGGAFQSVEEVDAYIRGLRDEWER